MKKNTKVILIIAISVLVVLLLIIIGIRNNIKKQEQQNKNEVVVDNRTEEQKSNELVSKLKSVSESERIRIYLGQYFKNIESKKYEEAYNVLYPQYKTNYFPTLESFKKYIEEKKYPDLLAINYNDIYMQGKYYIVEVTITDFLGKNSTFKESEKLIIQENDYNDYYISFQK